MIYLDNAATTFPKPDEVYTALNNANKTAFNAGRGSYKVAREKTTIIEKTREKILSIANIKSGKVVFTPSATIALNSIIFGLDLKENDYIYISPFEHNSVVRPLEELKEKIGVNIEVIPFTENGWELDEERLTNLFAIKNPKAIFLSQISNATGYLLPYEKIFELSNTYESINILDSSQAYSIVPLNSENINYIVFAGHKSLYSSFGIAGYIKLKQDKLKKTIFGGTGSDTMNPNMPDEFPTGYEAGSPNIVAIEGLNASLDWISKHNIYKEETKLTKYLIESLKSIEKAVLYLPAKEEKVFGIVSFNIEGYTSDDVGKILDDEFDILVRTGYHCAPLINKLEDFMCYNGTVRASLSYFNKLEDIDHLVKALKTL